MNWAELLNGIASEAEKHRTQDERDYRGEDGLLRCWKCGKPKEMLFDPKLPGWEAKIVVAQCDCQIAEMERQEAARKELQRLEKIERLRSAGFQDPAMKAWTFASDDGCNEPLMRKARNYVRNWREMRDQNIGLLLWGTVGTGKTFASACIANELIDHGVPVIMTSFPRVINTLQGMRDSKQQYLDAMNDCDLLIIDDFAVERQTEYAQEIIYEVVDSRYKVGYPMIVTTNLTTSELKNPADVSKRRIYSRLLEMCHPVEVTGGDRRRAAIIRNYASVEAKLNAEEPDKTATEGA